MATSECDPSSHTHRFTLTHNIHRRDGLMVRLEGELARIGLEVYRQNFSAVRPAVSRGQQVFVSGQNTYGILRAGRSPSAESLVFSAPVGADDNTHGLAMMLSLAQYFKSELRALCLCYTQHSLILTLL